jgi:hypothetical protein
MNLFRSEEHARIWGRFNKEAESGLLPLRALMEMHSGPRHREILSGHYITNFKDYTLDYHERVKRVTQDNPFWRR